MREPDRCSSAGGEREGERERGLCPLHSSTLILCFIVPSFTHPMSVTHSLTHSRTHTLAHALLRTVPHCLTPSRAHLLLMPSRSAVANIWASLSSVGMQWYRALSGAVW